MIKNFVLDFCLKRDLDPVVRKPWANHRLRQALARLTLSFAAVFCYDRGLRQADHSSEGCQR